VLTGKGNIRDSRANAIEIIEKVVAAYLGVGEQPEETLGDTSGEVAAIAEQASTGEPMTVDAMKALASRINARHEAIGYTDFASWIASSDVRPAR
jgi:hypothetical protein